MYADHLLNIAIDHPRSSDASATDEALVERIAVGDTIAMGVLFARHYVRVNRFALRLVRNRALAEDLVSATFLEVWRHAAGFKAQSAVSTWLLAIAGFKAFSELRRRSHDELDDESANAVADPADNPEAAILKKDKGEVLRACLIALSPNHREMIDLVYYHEKSIEEVAEIVGISQSTVKSRVFYARQRLSRLLKVKGVDDQYY